ncbi:MAG: hypothetical protein OXT67_10225, partial [Zetaproteobacteria bacterium]|nr:hypothetical protein [Zetaproteobacteria bacterium]
LELPVYQGNNVRHAQESLSAARHKDLPLKTHELAWSCEILSYATQKNMTRFASELNSFYHSHPKSRYIESYIAPLEKYRIDRLTEYIQQKKPYEAIEYYEKYKEHFLSQLSPSQQYGLFKAYYETRNIAQARPFAESFYKQLPHDQPIDLLRFLVFTAEYQSTYEDSQDLYQMQEESIARMMELNPQISNSSAIQYHIVRLMQTKLAHKHYPWLIRLMKPWSNDDVEQLCSQTYSLLSTKLEHSLKEQPTQTTAVWNDLKVLIDQWFPEIFNRSVECSRNLLSLEAILGRQPEFTAQSIQLWQQRTEWPQKKIHLPMQWQLAMQAYNTPQFKPLALQLMQRIAAEDPRSYVEAKMARVFVDTQKTETEDLWD